MQIRCTFLFYLDTELLMKTPAPVLTFDEGWSGAGVGFTNHISCLPSSYVGNESKSKVEWIKMLIQINEYMCFTHMQSHHTCCTSSQSLYDIVQMDHSKNLLKPKHFDHRSSSVESSDSFISRTLPIFGRL